MSAEEEERRDSAPPGEAVVEAEDQGDEDWSPFDEIQDDFKPRPIPKVTAADGLPTNFAPVNESDIPELSTETLVCMGDYSEFVIRDEWGNVLSRWKPESVERTPSGKWRARSFEGRLKADGSAWTDRGDLSEGSAGSWIEVAPLRSPCTHYARQLTQFDLNAQAQVMLRVCAARRTTEGAFMSLRDRAMWACELRHPHDAVSHEKLDAFDRSKMDQGKRRELFPIFSSEPTNGIFGGTHGGK